jgi:hypothetical protein
VVEVEKEEGGGFVEVSCGKGLKRVLAVKGHDRDTSSTRWRARELVSRVEAWKR